LVNSFSPPPTSKSMVDKDKKKQSHKRWVENNKEKYRSITNRCKKEWSIRNPEKVREYRRKYNLKHYGYASSPRVKKVYEDIYTPLLQAQNGKCSICGSFPNGKRLSIDHNHSTGKIRGLLCSHCNLALGLFQDSVTNLSRAIGYLEERN
jgi:hypothetical protein